MGDERERKRHAGEEEEVGDDREKLQYAFRRWKDERREDQKPWIRHLFSPSLLSRTVYVVDLEKALDHATILEY